MTERQTIVLNFLAFLLFHFLLSAFETSTLAQIFTRAGAPVLWLAGTVYFALNRGLVESVVWVYATTLLNMSFSYSPVAFSLFSQLIIVFAVRALKARIYWPGGTYFMMAFGVSMLTYTISYYFLSLMIEDNAMATPHWLSLFFNLVWVPVVSFPLFFIFEKIDQITKRPVNESPMESF